MKTVICMTAAVALLTLAACSGSEESSEGAVAPATSPATVTELSVEPTDDVAGGETAITITAGDQTIEAVLNDSQVAQDFAATLPVTLPWFRNLDIEYITELGEPMTETGPFYTDVQPGDLVYYNPLDSITIIYEETSSVPTLTKMGEITSDLNVFEDLPDNVDMRIEAN